MLSWSLIDDSKGVIDNFVVMLQLVVPFKVVILKIIIFL